MHYNIKKSTVPILLLLLMTIGVGSSSFADQTNNSSINATIPEIKEIPGIDSGEDRDFENEAAQYRVYIGTVDQVHSDGIVLDDFFHKIAPSAIISGATKGKRVRFELNSKEEIILCEPVK